MAEIGRENEAGKMMFILNPHKNIKKTCVFEYAGSAWTPVVYAYHMKAMHSFGQFGPAVVITYNMGSEIPITTVCAAIKVLRGPRGPLIFV